MKKLVKKNLPAMAILALAAVFLLLGIAGGEAATVYRKAANVCMECIGLG